MSVKTGFHVVPAFMDFQTPPDAARHEDDRGIRLEGVDVRDAPGHVRRPDVAPLEILEERVHGIGLRRRRLRRNRRGHGRAAQAQGQQS